MDKPDIFHRPKKFKTDKEQIDFLEKENAEMTRCVREEYLPKKVAAGEVLKPRKELKIAVIIGIAISFLGIAAVRSFSFFAGGIVVVLGIGALMFISVRNETEIKRLKSKYGLEDVSILSKFGRKIIKENTDQPLEK